jgi:hypothetical protein
LKRELNSFYMNVNVLEDVITHDSSLDNVKGVYLYRLTLSYIAHPFANPRNNRSRHGDGEGEKDAKSR